MFADVVYAGLFAQFHRDVDDALLDEAARLAGCATGIGRLSLVSDAMLRGIVDRLGLRSGDSLLDIGCGRGFVERWLAREARAVRAVGIDRSHDAVATASTLAPNAQFVADDYRTHRFDEPFDAALALEITPSGTVDPQVLAAACSALRAGGTLAVTAVSLEGRSGEHRAHMLAAMRKRFSRADVIDATHDAAPFARALYDAWLHIEGWSPTIAPRMRAQAAEVLAAVDRGDFRYAIGFGTA